MQPVSESRRAHAPGYWRDEIGGELKPAIEAYIKNEPLTLRQIALLRAYLRQWIGAGAWDLNPHADDAYRASLRDMRQSADDIRTVADIHAWLVRAMGEGIDPL